MISAPPGLFARYQTAEGRIAARSVMAFDEEGYALVLNDRAGRLVRAHEGVRDAELKSVDVRPEPRIVAMAPADGWRAAYQDESGAQWTEPLIGWGITSDGSVIPMDSDSDGEVKESMMVNPGKLCIYHPGEAPGAARSLHNGFAEARSD